MELSEILNFVLGGSLLATVIGIVTLRATVRKANAEAEKAKADAETVRIDNAEHATRILVDNIVEPLKDELNATRKDLQATKREMARLGVREHPKDSAGNGTDGNGDGPGGQHEERSPPGADGDGAEVGGEAGDTG